MFASCAVNKFLLMVIAQWFIQPGHAELSVLVSSTSYLFSFFPRFVILPGSQSTLHGPLHDCPYLFLNKCITPKQRTTWVKHACQLREPASNSTSQSLPEICFRKVGPFLRSINFFVTPLLLDPEWRSLSREIVVWQHADGRSRTPAYQFQTILIYTCIYSTANKIVRYTRTRNPEVILRTYSF